MMPRTIPHERIRICVHCGREFGECFCLRSFADPRCIVVSREHAAALRGRRIGWFARAVNRFMPGVEVEA